MRSSYVTLTRQKINLSGIEAADKVFLGRILKAFQGGEAYPNVVNRIHQPGSRALLGGRWVTKKVLASPLYRVCLDLADRLGIAQGFLGLGKSSSVQETGIAESDKQSFISTEEAAKRLHVTAEAVRKAIREKRLPAQRVGRTYLIEHHALEGYAVQADRRSAHRTAHGGKRAANHR